MAGGRLADWQLAGDVMLSGFIAIIWVYSFTHNFKLLPFAVLILIGSFFYADIWTSVEPSHDLQARLEIDSIGIIIQLVLGYIFLIQFIMTEGTQHVRLKTEMNLAKELHDILVPTINFKNGNWEIYGRAIPTEEVGGDLVDIYENGNELTCYIADVSGHGVAAGLLMGMFKTSIHTYLQSNASIATIFNNCNKVLYRLKKQSMFITCACIRFFSDNVAEYSIAGHLPILHFEADKEKISQLNVKQIPITTKQDYEYVSKKVNINPGDLLVLLTDGLIEVTNSNNEEFGIEGIEKFILENIDLSIENLFTKLFSQIKNYGQQRDDQTMLLIRHL